MAPRKEGDKRGFFARELLKWHASIMDRMEEELPWRKERDPFKILVAEILLRKTTRRQVSDAWRILTEKYSGPGALATATVKLIEEDIRPLGMEKKRAVLLKGLAQTLIEKYGGLVPSERSELISLPGVGDYAANAVLCLAYEKDVPMVDTNVIRVVSRVFSVKSEKKRARTDPKIWGFVGSMIPKGEAKRFNMALLDFANMICTSRNPKHTTCPVNSICDYCARSRAV